MLQIKTDYSDNTEYYIYPGIESVQKQLLNTLNIIHELCEDNNLSYFLSGGSAIGARRHGGFIPWDDDLDIDMPKSDYLRLIGILNQLEGNYELRGMNDNNHCCSYFGIKSNLFIKMKGRYLASLLPIRVDIRPLNIISANDQAIRENQILRNIANLIIFNRCDDDFYAEATNVYKKRFHSDRNEFLQFYNYEYGHKSSTDDNVYYMPPYLEYSTYDTYSYNDIFPLSRIEFSGIASYISSPDNMLRDFYGDYMQMPTMNNRRPEGVAACKCIDPNIIYDESCSKMHKNKIHRVLFMATIKGKYTELK